MPGSAAVLFVKGAIAKYTAWAATHAFAAGVVKAGVQLALSAALTQILAPDVPSQGASTNIRQPLPPRRQGVGTFRAQGALNWIGAKGATLDRVILWPENDGAPVEVYRTWLNDDLVTLFTDPDTGQLSVKPFADGRYGAKLFGDLVRPLIRVERRAGLMSQTAYSALHAFNPAYPANARNDGTPTTWFSVTHGKLEKFGEQLPGREGEPNQEMGYSAYDWRYDSTAILWPATDETPAVTGDGPQRRDDRSTWGVTGNNVVWGVNLLWRTYGADWAQCFAPFLGELAEEADVCDEAAAKTYGVASLMEAAETGAEVLKLSNADGLETGSVLMVGDFELEVLGVAGDEVTVAPLEAGFGAGTTFSWMIGEEAAASEPRYRIGFEFSKGTPPGEIIQHVINGMAGWFGVNRQGGYIFRAGRDKTPTVIFGDEEILDITFEDGPPPDQAVNILTTSYSDPELAYAMVEGAQWKDEADIATRGEERPKPFAPIGVHSGTQLAELASVAGQRELLPRGTFRTRLSARRGLGHDVVGLRCRVLEDLYAVAVDVIRVRTDLGRAVMEWQFRFRPTFGVSAPGAPTLPPPVPLPTAGDRPTIESWEVFHDSGGNARLRLFAAGPDPERIDIAWKVGVAGSADTGFNTLDVMDLDPDTPVKLETGILPEDLLKVIVGYQTGGGNVVWMDEADAVPVDTTAAEIIYDGNDPL